MGYDIFYTVNRPKEKELIDLSLQELAKRLLEISKRQNQITNFDLTQQTCSLAYKELEEQKRKIRATMHVLVERM